jgi:hypothetical protein
VGFVSPSRPKYVESTIQQLSQACLRSTRSVSHALDGFLLFTPCGFISLRCHVRDFSSGFSPATSRAASSPATPLLSLAPMAAPRLQGLAPIADPLLVLEALCSCSSLDPVLSSCSLRFICRHLEVAFALLHSWPCCRRLVVTLPVTFSVSMDAWPFLLVSREFYLSELCGLPLALSPQRDPTHQAAHQDRRHS